MIGIPSRRKARQPTVAGAVVSAAMCDAGARGDQGHSPSKPGRQVRVRKTRLAVGQPRRHHRGQTSSAADGTRGPAAISRSIVRPRRGIPDPPHPAAIRQILSEDPARRGSATCPGEKGHRALQHRHATGSRTTVRALVGRNATGDGPPPSGPRWRLRNPPHRQTGSQALAQRRHRAPPPLLRRVRC